MSASERSVTVADRPKPGFTIRAQYPIFGGVRGLYKRRQISRARSNLRRGQTTYAVGFAVFGQRR